MHSIDLNVDAGEGAPRERELLALATSASVACGAHAGSEAVMRATVRAAHAARVVVGAHPGYPDRAGFGRREIDATPTEIDRWVADQVALLGEICRAEGVPLRYVKAHGALYHRAARDAAAAQAIAAAVWRVDRTLALLAPRGSAMLDAARAVQLTTGREAFVDRGYLPDGSLVPRGEPGALLTDPHEAAERALRIARGEAITDRDGHPLRVVADSLCIHGDSPDALAMARAVRARLIEADVRLASFVR